MKLLYVLTFLIFFTGCKTVTTQVQTLENKQVVMVSSEKWTFCEPEEKLSFSFSPKNGGQVLSLFWEGKKVADQFTEKYPNKELDIKELKPRVIDDGSGLIIVDSTLRGNWQLRRSYSLQYHKDTDEHLIEVIYNVKNYSAESDIDQQWIKTLSLPKSLRIELKKDSIESENKELNFKIVAINVSDLELSKSGQKLTIGNKNSFKLGFKERMSWKVLYILKSTD